jgi:ATP-dependent Clp protease ATP-binding subunit ClpA
LAGLLEEGVAAAFLENLGITAEAIRDSGRRLFGSPLSATDRVPSMSAEAKCALDAAAHIARTNARDSNSGDVVGTEHLLAVLALDPGSRARRILNDLDVDIAVIKRELDWIRGVAGSEDLRQKGHRDRFRTAVPCAGMPILSSVA